MAHCWSCAMGETEFTEADGKLIKATVRYPNGRIMGSGHLCEDHLEMYLEDQEREGYIIKAEKV